MESLLPDAALAEETAPLLSRTTTRSGPKKRRKSRPSRRQLALVQRVCELIDAQDGEPVTLAELAEAVDWSPWYLQRIFKKAMGVSPRDYADARRSAGFRERLRNGESIAGATYGSGYGSSSRVYERSNLQLGMTPSSYAKGGRGARIVYAIVDSPLGRLLVAATAKGICFVSIAESDAELEANLRHEYPQAASIVRDDEAIAPSVEVILAYLAGETPDIALPLDIRATAFQRRVWQELRAIPAGETRSYAEIAEAMGEPNAQRAVGQACAHNPVALVVPCHRALRADDGLGGYRWGPERKVRLLDQEAELA